MLPRKSKFNPGDPVICRVTKHGTRPGPRARDIEPTAHGEDYTYLVDKFWVVVELRDGNRLLLRTRRGKEHLVDANSPNIRHARWWERLMYRDRFPPLEEGPSPE